MSDPPAQTPLDFARLHAYFYLDSFSASSYCYWLPSTVTIRALRFWRPMFCQHELESNTGGGGRDRTYLPKARDLQSPVPPLEHHPRATKLKTHHIYCHQGLLAI